jgi:hypothetical protein
VNARKKRRKCDLTQSEVQAIIKTILCEKLSHSQAAVLFRIKPQLVHTLLKCHKRDEKFLEKLKDKEDKQRLKIRSVLDESLKMLNSKHGLSKAA